MKFKTFRHIFFISLTLLFSTLFASDLQTVSGRILNGNGSSEKCEDVKVRLYIDSDKVAETYPDGDGYFQFILNASIGSSDQPEDPTLAQNYPNPFNNRTEIPYRLSSSSHVNLNIYDILGRKVRSLVQGYRPEGNYAAAWDGRSDTGQQCATGMYIYVLEFDGRIEKRKMMLTGSNGNMLFSGGTDPQFLAKPATSTEIKINFKSRSISDSTLIYDLESVPVSLYTGTVPLHFYPFIRGEDNTYSLMSGESIRDTLNIYHEGDLTIECDEAAMAWDFISDSLAVIRYENVTEDMAVLDITEEATGKIIYGKTYFNLSPRLQVWPHVTRRGYPGMSFQHDLSFEGNDGTVSYDLASDLPDGFSYSAGHITGTPSAPMETMLYFDLTDDREITVRDSLRLTVGDSSSVFFNDYVLDMIEYYPRDGRFDYDWGDHGGVTQDLVYKGSTILSAAADGSGVTYCCGLTFEAFFMAMTYLHEDLELSETINGMTASDMRSLKNIWFVTTDPHRGPDLALETYGLGESIDDFEDVLPGDFLQIWRTSGSGHSVVFIDWTTNAAGDTTGIRYWSTQPSTDGINYNTEYFPAYGGTLDREHLYFGRVTGR